MTLCRQNKIYVVREIENYSPSQKTNFNLHDYVVYIIRLHEKCKLRSNTNAHKLIKRSTVILQTFTNHACSYFQIY